MKTSAVIEPVSKHTSQAQMGTFIKLITTCHTKISNRYIGVLAQVWKFNHTKSWVRSQYNQIYCIYPNVNENFLPIQHLKNRSGVGGITL